MNDPIVALGELVTAQQRAIDSIVDRLENAEGRHEDALDLLLDRHILVRDILIDTLEQLLNLVSDENNVL